jgi:hypothetical protein
MVLKLTSHGLPVGKETTFVARETENWPSRDVPRKKKQTYLLVRVLNQMKEQSENLLFKLAITEPESSNMS